MNLIERVNTINGLFLTLLISDSRIYKEFAVKIFREENVELEKDLDFCFEVLAGKHKLGYTYNPNTVCYSNTENFNIDLTIEDLVNKLKTLGSTDKDIEYATAITPIKCREFISALVNREFKLGYSNKHNMITNLSPMLAKKYPEAHREQFYYVQEKLDGNRCIAYCSNIVAIEQWYDIYGGLGGSTYNCTAPSSCPIPIWKFQSRSGKPLNVNFDMSWADINQIFDGEIMTLSKAGSRDFNRTSGAINGKYTNKSELHYYIYDLMDDSLPYKERLGILTHYCTLNSTFNVSNNCSILPVLDLIWVYPNPEYNGQLDEMLDMIVSKGGEGLILRDPEAFYKHGEPRTNALLKYKKVQTMDLRILGYNEGKGKYEGMIGSFICETDDHSIVVSVGGINDEIRASDFTLWYNKIIEVAYFDISVDSKTNQKSLRFPRFKKVRNDKNTTSIY